MTLPAKALLMEVPGGVSHLRCLFGALGLVDVHDVLLFENLLKF